MAMGEQRKGALQFNTFLLNDLTKRLNQQEMVEVDGVGGVGGGVSVHTITVLFVYDGVITAGDCLTAIGLGQDGGEE